MKQVTMESVQKRIADLESAGKVVGGLSLSSEFELACLRELVAVTEQRDALVVENVELKGAHKSAIDAILNPKNKGVIYLNEPLITSVKTPATDAARASLRAEGFESTFDDEPFGFIRRRGDSVLIDVNGDPHIKDGMPVFARQLRESKGANHA
jgi:hypothetical protein